jgi:hypothetical protein
MANCEVESAFMTSTALRLHVDIGQPLSHVLKQLFLSCRNSSVLWEVDVHPLSIVVKVVGNKTFGRNVLSVVNSVLFNEVVYSRRRLQTFRRNALSVVNSVLFSEVVYSREGTHGSRAARLLSRHGKQLDRRTLPADVHAATMTVCEPCVHHLSPRA